MRACIILHNMIINDQRDTDLDEVYETVDSTVGPPIHYNVPSTIATRLQRDAEIMASPVYTQLQKDLIEHVWSRRGFH